MRRAANALVLTLVGVVLATPDAVAYPAIRPPSPKAAVPAGDLGIADTQDVLFFAETRLVRLRVHLQAVGKPLAERWTGQLRKYFDFLDRNADGELSRPESEYALSNAGVAQMLQTGYAYQRPDDAAKTFAQIDRNRDGRVQFDEFALYYAPSARRVVSAFLNPSRDVYADSLTDALFKVIDADRDGRLSRAELSAVERLFAALDADEDECLTAPEIVPDVFNGRTVPVPRPVPKGPANLQDSMIAFRTGEPPNHFAATILARYDRDGNYRLSETENPFGEIGFLLLDRNSNREVTSSELGGWKDLPPDLHIDMTLGTKPEESSVRVRPREDRLPPMMEGALKPAGPGAAVLKVGTQLIHLSCYAPAGVYGRVHRPGFLTFPDSGTGFVSEKEIAGPQYQSLRVLFDMIDRNADGKMSRPEFDAFFALQESFTQLPLALVYAAPTPSLFQLLDANGDGRLGVREVRGAWDRLIVLEPGGKEHVTRAALQPQGAVRFGRSAEAVRANPAAVYTQAPVPQATRGPVWFRKFDRNGDGELSRSEFPGRAAAFEALDADRDGYVTLEEAEAADRRLRVRK